MISFCFRTTVLPPPCKKTSKKERVRTRLSLQRYFSQKDYSNLFLLLLCIPIFLILLSSRLTVSHQPENVHSFPACNRTKNCINSHKLLAFPQVFEALTVCDQWVMV